MGERWPTCDQALRRWVERVVAELRAEMEPGLAGIYLHGSLALGSFYPPKSDVDLLLVVDDPLTPAQRRSFSLRCATLSRDRPIVGGLEAWVVHTVAAHEARHPMPIETHFSEDSIPDEAAEGASPRTDSDLATHCHAILERGICIWGRPIADVFGPVDRADFIASIADDTDWILDGDNIVETPFYGVLNLCRAMWVWNGHSSRLAPTKDEAGEWALERLPHPEAEVVQSALEAYRDSTLIRPQDRRTAGRDWDQAGLLRFRDYVRDIRSQLQVGPSQADR